MVASKGGLREVPVHRIFLHLGEEAFTGILKVQGARAKESSGALKIHFIDGDIVHVTSPVRSPDRRLGTLLSRGALVSSAEVEEALERSKAEGDHLGTSLVKGNKLSRRHLEDVLCIQFLDDLHDALRWREGSYVFQSQVVDEISGGPPGLDPMRLVEVGRRHAEVWAAIRVKIPSLGETFVKLVDGPIDPADARSQSITEQELKVFSLIHRSRTVGDLSILARLELFEVCRSLALLSSGGFIERQKVIEPKVLKAPKEDTMGKVKAALAFYSFTALLLMVLLGIILGIFLGLRSPEGEPVRPTLKGTFDAVSVDPMRNALTVAQMERISTAIEVYKARMGDYPSRVELLLELELLTQEDLHYPDYVGTYKYKPSGNTYRLSRPKR
jgi:hypothetical protein